MDKAVEAYWALRSERGSDIDSPNSSQKERDADDDSDHEQGSGEQDKSDEEGAEEGAEEDEDDEEQGDEQDDSSVDDHHDAEGEKAQVVTGTQGRVLGDGSVVATVPDLAATGSGTIIERPGKVPSRGPRRGITTLGDIDGGPGHGHRRRRRGGHGRHHDHDDDDDDDDDDPNDGSQDFFTGGEKSGLAVHNPADPRRAVEKILNQARKYETPSQRFSTPSLSLSLSLSEDPRLTRDRTSMAGSRDDPASAHSHFGGTGQTLGGDDTPSQIIPDPDANVSDREPPRVERTLHFWQDGFSVEDGPLYRFDDPASAPILALINSGQAPIHIMEVEPHQPVDVVIQKHQQDYVVPKRKYKPFAGGGHRLGSPTTLTMPAATTAASTTTSTVGPTSAQPTGPVTVNTDESQPTITLQIRLGDGTRLTTRFNPTHTIGDVYDFVLASSPASNQRPWALMTTFPSKELNDTTVLLGDLPEFKRGGVMIQKWN